jgi:hypothetical protein
MAPVDAPGLWEVSHGRIQYLCGQEVIETDKRKRLILLILSRSFNGPLHEGI